MTDRIDYSKGNLDDVVVENVSMFRLEYMDKGCVWIRLYRDGDAPDVVIWLNSKKKIEGHHNYE